MAMINYAAMSAMRRVGTYWHIFPTQKQARKAIWEGITKDGTRIMDQAFPGFSNPKHPMSIVKKTRDDDMMVEFKNGAIWRLVGGDAYDGLVGSNVVGAVFSEYAITDPAAWTYIRPILVESGGWAAFISTPRGENHWFDLCQVAQKSDRWHYELLTVEDTGALSLADIQAERDEGMTEDEVRQEFYCDFTAANIGSIFGSQLELLQKAGRITDVPYNPNYAVETSWDLGVVDKTSIIFWQRVGENIHVIDHHSEPGKEKGLPYFLNICSQKPYAYSRHIGPHDMDREFWGTASTPIEIAAQHGFQFVAAPKLKLDTGLTMARQLIPRCRFDEENCEDLLHSLKHYQKEWDKELKIFSEKPVHDWSSDDADAFRTYAQTPSFLGAIPQWANEHPTGPKIPKSNIARIKMGMEGSATAAFGLDRDDDYYDPLAGQR